MSITDSKLGQAPGVAAPDAEWPEQPRTQHRVVGFYLDRSVSRPKTLIIQVLLLAAFFLGWQYLPQVSVISSHVHILNSFYVSSPSAVYDYLVKLCTGSGAPSVWPYLWVTVIGATAGAGIGVGLGALCGLLLSESITASSVLRPFLVLSNSVPRVALIPIVVVLVGPTIESSIVSVALVVFFLAFFNAYEGGISVPRQMVENALLLGATRRDIVLYLRSPYVLNWTIAMIPNAISFGIVVAVTNELLTGLHGMGALLLTATTNLQASLTFAVITVLAVVGLLLFGVAEFVKRMVIRWLGQY